jgi:hypothetical protein
MWHQYQQNAHLWNSFYKQRPPTYFERSRGNIQGCNKKDRRLKDDRIIEVIGSIEDIKLEQ